MHRRQYGCVCIGVCSCVDGFVCMSMRMLVQMVAGPECNMPGHMSGVHAGRPAAALRCMADASDTASSLYSASPVPVVVGMRTNDAAPSFCVACSCLYALHPAPQA